jgi:nucleolar MIF4G domain-containing protein 1
MVNLFNLNRLRYLISNPFIIELDVTATLTDIILTSISQKANLLDSFVITYATIVASLYRLIGIEFGKQKKIKGIYFNEHKAI